MADYLKRWPAPKTFIEAGDEIKGTLVAWDPLSEKYPVLHIQTADGMVRIVRITQVRLHEQLVDLNPDLGDRLWIRYEGEEDKAMKGHSKAKRFTVEIRRANGSQPSERPLGEKTGDVPEDNVPRAGT